MSTIKLNRRLFGSTLWVTPANSKTSQKFECPACGYDFTTHVGQYKKKNLYGNLVYSSTCPNCKCTVTKF